MATGGEVLGMLCPGVEWTSIGDEYEDINWNDKTPAISKEQYLAGFDQFDEWKSAQDLAKISAKAALLARLGITEDEAKLLLA
jgi:hypothetical protein